MNFKEALRRRIAEEALMNKAAAAILTPEAEQAAVQGGMPADPSMGGAPAGAPPAADPSMMNAQGAGGGQIPPEVLSDQGFIQWLQQQGVMLDPQSGMFVGPDGQPLPVDAIMQAYQAYQQEMMAVQQGAPQGGAPTDPAAMQGGAPAGAPPMDPAAMGGAPMDPAAMGGMPPQGGAPADGGLPPEVLQDEQFAQFMEQAVGAPLDPNQGTFVDPQSGQPLPPDMVMQAYQAYQQQMGGAPAEGGAAPEGGNEIPPEVLEQIQSVVDASIQNFSAQLDKKIESLLDKLETVKMALESMRDTDDKRDKADKEAAKELQDEIAAELNPEVKTAAEVVIDTYPQQKLETVQPPKPLNMFDYIINRNRK